MRFLASSTDAVRFTGAIKALAVAGEIYHLIEEDYQRLSNPPPPG